MKRTGLVLLFLAMALSPMTSLGQELTWKDYLKSLRTRAGDPGGETPHGPGKVYYFSNGGDDDNDCKSPQEACETDGKLEGLSLEPGDTVLFKRGETRQTHFAWLTDSENGAKRESPESPHRWIRYGAYGQEGSRPRLVKPDRKDVNVNKRSWLWIDRLDMGNWQAIRLRNKTHHLRFTHYAVRGAENACILIAGKRDDNEAHDIEFDGLQVTDCGRGGRNGEGIYGSHSVDVNQRGGRNITIKNCHLFGIPGEPINIKYETRNWTIDGCLIENNIARVNNDPGILSAAHSNIEDAGHKIRNTVITNNVGHDNEHNAVLLLGEGWTVRNVLVYNNKNFYGIRANHSSKVEGSTFDKNSRGFLSTEEVDHRPGLDMDKIKCNIGGNRGKNIAPEDEMFKDRANGDYRLRKANAHMGGGCGMSFSLSDLFDIERPAFAWSFGAMHFAGDDVAVALNPTPIGWCPCGCRVDNAATDTTPEAMRVSGGFAKCVDGCTPCQDGGISVPIEKDTVIGPVVP